MKPRLVTLSALVVLASCGLAAAQDDTPSIGYELTVHGEWISVRANEGSTIGLIDELGRQLGFEVIAHDVRDTPLTVDFERLPHEAAIRVICQRIGYVSVPDPVTGRTVRLVLTPSRSVAANRAAGRRDPLPKVRDPEPDPFDVTPDDEEPVVTTDETGASAP